MKRREIIDELFVERMNKIFLFLSLVLEED
jgi:hypothetical protein